MSASSSSAASSFNTKGERFTVVRVEPGPSGAPVPADALQKARAYLVSPGKKVDYVTTGWLASFVYGKLEKDTPLPPLDANREFTFIGKKGKSGPAPPIYGWAITMRAAGSDYNVQMSLNRSAGFGRHAGTAPAEPVYSCPISHTAGQTVVMTSPAQGNPVFYRVQSTAGKDVYTEVSAEPENGYPRLQFVDRATNKHTVVSPHRLAMATLIQRARVAGLLATGISPAEAHEAGALTSKSVIDFKIRPHPITGGRGMLFEWLEVDHIDFDVMNWRLDNLRVLLPNENRSHQIRTPLLIGQEALVQYDHHRAPHERLSQPGSVPSTSAGVTSDVDMTAGEQAI